MCVCVTAAVQDLELKNMKAVENVKCFVDKFSAELLLFLSVSTGVFSRQVSLWPESTG